MTSIQSMYYFNKISQDPFTRARRLLRMELHPIKIIPAQPRTIRLPIVRPRNRMIPERRIKPMDKITIAILRYPVEKLRPQPINGIPPDLWYLQNTAADMLRKSLNLLPKDPQTFRIILLTIAAHQLHPQTNPQYRLPKTADHRIKSALPQIPHRRTRLSHTRKDHLVRSPDLSRIIRNNGTHPDPFQCVQHRLYIACIIFDDHQLHKIEPKNSFVAFPISAAPSIARIYAVPMIAP